MVIGPEEIKIATTLDLRKNGKDVQLVKRKEYRAVSTLYIIMFHEENES